MISQARQCKRVIRCLSAVLVITFLSTNTLAAAPHVSCDTSTLAPQSEAKKNKFKDLFDVIARLEEQKEGRSTEKTVSPDMPRVEKGSAVYSISALIAKAEALFDAKKYYDAAKILDTVIERVRADFSSQVDIYKAVLTLKKDTIKGMLAEQMSDTYRASFEKFSGKPIADMSLDEFEMSLTPFNALLMRDKNREQVELIDADGYFEVSYIHDLFLDSRKDFDGDVARGAQHDLWRRYGVVVGGDGLVILRDVSGDMYIFQMDSQGHGYSAALLLNVVIPYLYKRWERGAQGYLADVMFKELNDKINQYVDMKDLWGGFVTCNAVHISAADGRTEYYSLGTEPALLVTGRGRVEPIMSDGSPIGMWAAEQPVNQKVQSTLRRGNRLVLYSDGVTESRISDAAIYGSHTLKELINRYIAEVHTLPAGKAADEVIKKVRSISKLTPDEEHQLKAYLVERAADYSSYGDDLRDALKKNPQLSPEQLNNRALSDIIGKTGIEEEQRLWNTYVDTRLDAFLNAWTGEIGELYHAVLDDFQTFNGLATLRLDSYVGNSLHLNAFIQERKALPRDEVIAALKKHHDQFSRIPITPSEMANDDLTLVSILYKGKPRNEAPQVLGKRTATMQVRFGPMDPEPVVIGDAHAQVITQISEPNTPNSVLVRSLLKKKGNVTVVFFSGKRLSYLLDGVIYINERLVADKAAGGLPSPETKEEKDLQNALVLLQFLLCVKLTALTPEGRSSRQVVERAVSYYSGLSRRDQDRLIAGLKNYRKNDPEADGYYRLFTMIRLRGIDASVNNEQERLVKLGEVAAASDAVSGSLREVASGRFRCDVLIQGLQCLKGGDAVDVGMDADIQGILTRLWVLLSDEKTRISDADRKAACRAAKKVMQGIVTRKNEIRTDQEQKVPFLKTMSEISGTETSYVKNFFLPYLIDGTMAVKGLQFVRVGDNGCKVKKGARVFGEIPSLNDMHVYRQGTTEYVVLDIIDNNPVVLEINILTQAASIIQYAGNEPFILLSPRNIVIKKTRVSTSGISIRRMVPEQPVYFVADGTLDQRGTFTFTTLCDLKDIPRKIPSLQTPATRQFIMDAFARLHRLYPCPGGIKIWFVCGNDRSSSSVAHENGMNVIVVDVEDIANKELFGMDLEEEMLHLVLSDMPTALRPPLAMEEIMTALLKVYRFRTLSTVEQQGVLDLLKSQENDLDDQGFYRILSLPVSLSLDSLLSEIIMYIGRPGVYPEDITAYLYGRAIDDVKDELYGRTAGADGRRSNWFQTMYELYPKEVVSPRVVAATSLPVEEIFVRLYRTDHDRLLKFIYSDPPEFLGILSPYEKYRLLQTEFRDVLLNLDPKARVKETLALMVVLQRLTDAGDRERFVRAYRSAGTVSLGYGIFKRGVAAPAPAEKRDAVGEAVIRTVEMLKRKEDMSDNLAALLQTVRSGILKGRLDNEKAEKIVRYLKSEGDRCFDASGRADLMNAVKFYQAISSLSTVHEVKYEAYDKARAFFDKLIERETMREPAELKKIRPRLTAASIDPDGHFIDRTLEDIVAAGETGMESSVGVQNVNLLLGYYGLDFAQLSFLKRNFHTTAGIFVIDGARKPGPKKLYFGEVRNSHLNLSKVMPKSYDNFYDGIIEPGRISTKNKTQVENDPKVRRHFELFLEFEQFHGFRFGKLFYDYYRGALVGEEPTYRRKQPLYEAVDLDGRVIDERTGYQIRSQALNYGESGKEKEIESAVGRVEAFLKQVDAARAKRNDEISLDRFKAFEGDIIPFETLSSLREDFIACKKDPLAFEKLSDYISRNVGGKGMSLQVMKALGLDVPAGFTIAAKNYKKYKDTLAAQPAAEIRVSDLVDYSAPLTNLISDTSLVSVRSGAYVSLPGLLDTILNVGLTPANVEQFKKAHGFSEEYVLDLYRIFLRGFAGSVFGMYDQQIDRLMAATEKELQIARQREGKPVPLDKKIEAYAKAFARESGRNDALQILNDPRRQVDEAVKAVFSSWDAPEAAAYRKGQGIADDIGTAVTIQQMVFGKPGVAFSRDRVTGENIVTGRVGNIVGGAEAGEGIEVLEKGIQDTLREQVKILERVFGDIQDVEFVVDTAGGLHFLQSRSGKKTAAAAAKAAGDMAQEGILDKYTAVRKVSPDQLRALFANPVIDYSSPAMRAHNGPLAVRNESGGMLKGDPVSSGVVTGVLAFSTDKVKELKAKGIAAILVKRDFELTDDSIEGIRQADGVIAVDGSDSSHGAQIATSFGKPAIVNMPDLIFRDREIIVTGMSEYRTRDGARLSGGALTQYVMKSGRKLGDLVKDGTLTVELKKFVEGDLITIDGTTGQVYECVVDENGTVIKSVMTVPPKENRYLNMLLETVSEGIPADAFAAPVKGETVPGTDTVKTVLTKYQQLLARVGIYGRGAELESAFKKGVRRIASDINSDNQRLEFDYAGLPKGILQRWWQYLAVKLEQSLKNVRYAYDDVSLDDFMRFIAGFRENQAAPLSALPVLQHDINTEAMYAVDKKGAFALTSDTGVYLGPFIPMYEEMIPVLAQLFSNEVSSGEIKKIRVVKRLREGADVRIANGELVIPMIVFGNETLLARWLQFVRARSRGEIGDLEIDQLISEDWNTIADFNAAADQQGNLRLTIDPAFETSLGYYLPVYLERARMIEEYFNRHGWPAGLTKIRIERLIKHGAHVEKPKGLMVFPLDMMKSERKFEVEALPHEKRHFEINQDREIEELLNVVLDIMENIAPLKRQDAPGYDVFMHELEADDARMQDANRAFIPMLDRLIEKNIGKPEGADYRYEKAMREKQLGGAVPQYNSFIAAVVNRIERMRAEGKPEDEVEKAVVKEAFSYIVMNEGIYPYESNMLKIRGSKEVVGEVAGLLKKYRAPDWYAPAAVQKPPAAAAVKQWWEGIPGIDFMARNAAKFLFITVIAIGFNFMAATPASAFDGKTILAALSTAGSITLNILAFSMVFATISAFLPTGGILVSLVLNLALNIAIVYVNQRYVRKEAMPAGAYKIIAANLMLYMAAFTVISTLLPVGGLFLNVVLNIAFVYANQRYLQWQQDKTRRDQYVPRQPVHAVSKAVNPSPKIIAEKVGKNVYKLPERPAPTIMTTLFAKGADNNIIDLRKMFEELRGQNEATRSTEQTLSKMGTVGDKKKPLPAAEGARPVNIANCPLLTLTILATSDGNPNQAAARDELVKRQPRNDKEKKMIEDALGRSVQSPAAAAIQAPSIWDRLYNSFKRLNVLCGPFWPIFLGMTFAGATPLDAAPLAETAQAPISRGISNIEVFSAVMAGSVFVSIIALIIAKLSGEKISTDKYTIAASGMDSDKWLDNLAKIFGRLYVPPEAKTMVVFERSGKDFVVKDTLMTDEEKAYADRFLSARGKTIDYLIEKMRAIIGKTIAAEPGGEMVQRVRIVDDDTHAMHTDKDAKEIIIQYPILEKEKLVRIFVIHEIKHVIIEIRGGTDGFLVEEVLAHSLQFVRDNTDYRNGKMNEAERRLFEETMDELLLLASERVEGRLTQRSTILKLNELVEKKEAEEQRSLPAEEVLWIAAPLVINFLRDRAELFGPKINAELAGMTDVELIRRVKELWTDQKPRVLAGKQLYTLLLPIAFVDYSRNIFPSCMWQLFVIASVLGIALTDGASFNRRLSGWYAKMFAYGEHCRRFFMMGNISVSAGRTGPDAQQVKIWDVIFASIGVRAGAKNIPSLAAVCQDNVPYIAGNFISLRPTKEMVLSYQNSVRSFKGLYPTAYLYFLTVSGILREDAVHEFLRVHPEAKPYFGGIAPARTWLHNRYIVGELLRSSGLNEAPELYDLFMKQKETVLGRPTSDGVRDGLAMLDNILIGKNTDMTEEQIGKAITAAENIGLLDLLTRDSYLAEFADMAEPLFIYADMVSREEGFQSCRIRLDSAEGDLDVYLLHAESFYTMRYDEKARKEVPVLKDLGSRILLTSLMRGRKPGSTRKFVWVATTKDGDRLRKLAGLPDGDLTVDTAGFAGDMTKIETDQNTARQFIGYVDKEVALNLKKGKDAGKNIHTTVITSAQYFEHIWRNDVRNFIFAILMGNDAMPSTAIVAVFGENVPDELNALIDKSDPRSYKILPKPVIRDINYLNEITRQSAELAVNA